MTILALESSCDENSAAILVDGRVKSLETVTQKVHVEWGGVVPELAGRSHLRLQDEIVCRALDSAGIHLGEVDYVASTSGPGLVGSLLVGYYYGTALALSMGVPFIPVHHMEAHLWSIELDRDPLPLPALVLLVSGGHTLLLLVRGFRNYELLGHTRDDALGEAYDKVGKLLGLSFPAGAEIDRLAQLGSESAITFPIALRDHSLDFSYSGLKTAVANCVKQNPEWANSENRPDLLASFQLAAIQSALEKVALAMHRFPVRSIAAAGGVAANSKLRSGLAALSEKFDVQLSVPPMRYCADNAAMVGYVAHKMLEHEFEIESLPVRPRWPITELGNVQTSPY
ncbi:tRNA (adenosine(37)-N6)-threonylcarbamoyltransferase complex transferase subunit TsaD [bacterium]|nr:tRNA (adenosine(37)-N6)-threonylcarbamoyltransferase complex transferase subunit TsaD [bacterium]